MRMELETVIWLVLGLLFIVGLNAFEACFR